MATIQAKGDPFGFGRSLLSWESQGQQSPGEISAGREGPGPSAPAWFARPGCAFFFSFLITDSRSPLAVGWTQLAGDSAGMYTAGLSQVAARATPFASAGWPVWPPTGSRQRRGPLRRLTLHVCYFGPAMQAPSDFGSRPLGTHQAPSFMRPGLKGGRAPLVSNPQLHAIHALLSADEEDQEPGMDQNGGPGMETVTRAEIYCPEVCILPRGRWHCVLGRVCHPSLAFAPREVARPGASHKVVRAGDGVHAGFGKRPIGGSERGPNYRTLLGYCSGYSQLLQDTNCSPSLVVLAGAVVARRTQLLTWTEGSGPVGHLKRLEAGRTGSRRWLSLGEL